MTDILDQSQRTGNESQSDIVDEKPRISRIATASLWLGIAGVLTLSVGVGVGWVPGFIALIMGIISMTQINRSDGKLFGYDRAKAGAIFGGITISLGIIIVLTTPQYNVDYPPPQIETRILDNTLQAQLELYNARQGGYPADLNALVSQGYIEDIDGLQQDYLITYDPATGEVDVQPQHPR